MKETKNISDIYIHDINEMFKNDLLAMLADVVYHKVISGTPNRVLRKVKQEKNITSGIVYIQTKTKDLLDFSHEYMGKLQVALTKKAMLTWVGRQTGNDWVDLIIVKRKLTNNEKLGKKNVQEYYLLARKIIKSGTLSKKDSSHIAIMFADATSSYKPHKNEQYIENLYYKLLCLIDETYRKKKKQL